MSNADWPWWICRFTDCDFSLADVAEKHEAGASVMQAHYQGHMAEDLAALHASTLEMIADIRLIASSGFLNPRHPGEGPQDVADRVERRRTGYADREA